MASRVAFLRGVNVGGHRVTMDTLRGLFVDAGFRDVATFIASGNVIFDAGASPQAEQERRIERMLAAALGYEVATFIRDFGELREVAEVPPFAPWEIADPSHALHVIFLRAPADASARKRLETLESDRDMFRFDGREAYWLSRGKISESPIFGSALTKATAELPHTMRSIKSLRRLLAKHG